MISKQLVIPAALVFAVSLPWKADAETVSFSFAGSGVSGTIGLTYGPATDARYPQAFVVTAISGTFSDSNNGLNIVNAPIGALEPITQDTPEPTNLLAPQNFSRFAVAAGLPDQNNGFLSYDNLFYPGGSPQTASDYPFHGGFPDIYGLLFGIGGGRVVNFWSNGDLSGTGTGPIDYGAAVVTSDMALDYVGGVSVISEPGAFGLLGSGLPVLWVLRRRQRRLIGRGRQTIPFRAPARCGPASSHAGRSARMS